MPSYFGFEDSPPGTVGKARFKRALTAIFTQQNDMADINNFMLDQEHGIIKPLLPQELECHCFLFEENRGDLDVPISTETMAGPWQEQFLEPAEKKIEVFNQYDTWTEVRRASLSSGCHPIPSTQALQIKHYQNDQVGKSKWSFSVRGDKLEEGGDNSE